ncbi:unnamed protein product, partial [Phaeothamnion confervicola]
MEDEVDEEQQLEQLAELERELEELRLENSVFASYHASNATEATEALDQRARRQRRRQQMPTSLTIEQKVEVANHQLEAASKNLEQSRKGSEKLIDTLRAVLEETDIRMAELKKDAYEFKRDVVVGAEDMRTGKIMAEKVVRYMEEKLRQRDSTMEKLRLKNASLKSQVLKARQLRAKDDMGEALHYIDFHQLQIENKQCIARIEEKNDDLVRLKVMTGRTVQALNNVKNRLNEFVAEGQWLAKETTGRADVLARLKRENE